MENEELTRQKVTQVRLRNLARGNKDVAALIAENAELKSRLAKVSAGIIDEPTPPAPPADEAPKRKAGRPPKADKTPPAPPAE